MEEINGCHPPPQSSEKQDEENGKVEEEQKEKNSSNLPRPEEWGPHVWYTIDVFVQGYGQHPSPKLQTSARHFFSSLGDLLPCPKCRAHYVQITHLKPVNHYLQDQKSLAAWVKWLKEQVHQNKNRESAALLDGHITGGTEDRIRQREGQQRAPASSDSSSIGPKHRPRSRQQPKQQPRSRQQPRRPRTNVAATNTLKPPQMIARQWRNSSSSSQPALGPRPKPKSFEQQRVEKLRAEWHGSESGFKRYVKSSKHYHRPCACS